MKFLMSSILIISFSIIGHTTSTHPIFGQFEKIIGKSKKITLHLIDQYPVFPVEQAPEQEYILDYPIQNSLILEKSISTTVVTALLDSNNYIQDNQRKCSFLGQFAIQIHHKKFPITILLSSLECPKAIIFCEGQNIDKKHYDLTDQNQIIPILSGLSGKVD